MKLVFACLLFALSAEVYAQRVVFSTDTTRLLYIGIPNKISIAVPNHDCDDLFLQSACCTINGEGCYYTVMPTTPGIDTFIISSKKNAGKIIDIVKVRARFIPDPKIVIYYSPSHPRYELLRNGPEIRLDNALISDTLFKIVEYDVIINRGQQIIYQCKNMGQVYEKVNLDAIGKMRIGDRIDLTDIIILGPDNRRRNMGWASYTFQ